MTNKKKIIAMLLAGGQGSRLGVLTKTRAKPAVPYGGKYKIIDFPLSNCTNSGIDTVGVLTQYQPLELNSYISTGAPWDLDSNTGGVFILPPYLKAERGEWYSGTANAIYQNSFFIDKFDPDYVLVLSGDHIYKMDYNAMLKFHIKTEASATIAVIEVPIEDASRFGIMNTDKQSRIVDFEEKPAKPRSNLASMGVYIFNWPVLRAELSCDEEDPNSDHDFGKNIIPKMLSADMRLMAYRFTGYWKDVGTIGSLWEANMDLLDRPEEINLRDRNWRIYSRNPIKPAHYIADNARVVNSALTDGCNVCGHVEHSMLFNSVTVEKGAVVRDSILMPGVRVEAGARLNKCIVSFGTIIGKHVRAGADVEGECRYSNTRLCQDGITVFERGLKIRDGAVVPGNCMVEFLEPDEIVEAHFRV